ncbi:MAG: glycosyltransferase family 2 protein [Bacteroidales bacterium]|nr:glycosyltransferase family 2 protein [Bacteroidales bacterium]
MVPKKTAALTMLRGDELFLRKWVEYYGAQLGRENLYIYFDGLDQKVPAFCKGCHTGKIEHLSLPVSAGDRRRITYLSERAAELFAQGYEMVIGTDVDEFLIVDPALGMSLPEFLSSVKTCRTCISGLGIDVGQNTRAEGPLDPEKPFLAQRRYAKLSTRYSKASVLLQPCTWGSGFHRVRGKNFRIEEGLYLFHFGSADLSILKAKMSDSEKLTEGWEHHLNKRNGTIMLASTATPKDWRKATAFARYCQNLIRPPHMWNKPAMFEMKILVEIPSRFSGIV